MLVVHIVLISPSHPDLYKLVQCCAVTNFPELLKYLVEEGTGDRVFSIYVFWGVVIRVVIP